MLRNAILAGGLLGLAMETLAQTATPSPATCAPMIAGAREVAVLRTGTKVPLKLSKELPTKAKNLHAGQRFNMEVAETVLVNGQSVSPPARLRHMGM